MSRCSCLTGRSVGSVLGLMTPENKPPLLMTLPLVRVRHPSGVSSSFGLTRRSAGDPEEREREPDKEEDAVSMRLGIQELLRHREKDGGAGYLKRGELPPSMCSRTASNVWPWMPNHWCHPSELKQPRGVYLGRFRELSGSDDRMRAISAPVSSR
ncbi:hypothetical protein D1007_62402 [Hordeum vulgare]|nr:hypothetical protein D1007_62402 [Hordeum vulgare]